MGVTLSAENFRQCYLPPGFAHGFAVVSAVAQVEYKCTDLYDPKSELGIAWNDPAIGIDWPLSDPLLSDRDMRHLTLSAVMERLPVFAPITNP
jgi:dTDP-4-dehydrorhamnose 3,5-epimerase